MKKSKYKVVISNEPEEKMTHLVIYECETDRGYNYQRVFKGTYKECLEQKNLFERSKKIVSKSKRNGFKLFRKKTYN